MSVVVVTGGCGFIGSNFVRLLLETDPTTQVVNFDALTYAGRQENVADVASHPRYRFVHGDITDRDAVRGVFAPGAFAPGAFASGAFASGVDALINFAAESHVDRSIHDSGPFIRTNVLGTQVLLDAAREFKLRRFVHISTDEVYGSLGPSGCFTEDSPLAPSSPYSASKAAADLLVQSAVATFQLPAIIVRCSNNYGPYQFPEKLIPLFIANMLRDEPVPLYGDGRQVRDWIHVRDSCAAIAEVWRRGRPGDIYNIGGSCEISNLELTHLLLKELGKPATLIRHVADRPGHDRRYALDAAKIARELGWRPAIPFLEGLRQTVRWYREHPEWVARVRGDEYLKYYQRQYGGG